LLLLIPLKIKRPGPKLAAGQQQQQEEEEQQQEEEEEEEEQHGLAGRSSM
jgi:hypothetical protein